MAYTRSKTLLQSIKSNDAIAWQAFYSTYRPLIKYCGVKQHIPSDQLDDLVQKVMLKIFKSQKSFTYDPSRGKFRSYLGRIIGNEIFTMKTKMMNTDLISDEMPSPDWLKNFINEEWQSHIYEQASLILRQRVSPETYQAYEMYSLQNQPAPEVASFLSMSIQNVYEAKRRCTNLLKEIISSLSEL